MARRTLHDWYVGSAEGGIDGLEYQFGLSVLNLLAQLPKEYRPYVSILSGYRSIAHQQYLYDKKLAEFGGDHARTRKWVAPPGKSNHQDGLAIDFRITHNGARQWLHANAAKYQLRFPMSHESWHIEPMGVRDGTFRHSGRTYTPGFVIDGKMDSDWAHPSPEAYTDGQGLEEVDNTDPAVQMRRMVAMLGNHTGSSGVLEVDPLPTANRNLGIGQGDSNA